MMKICSVGVVSAGLAAAWVSAGAARAQEGNYALNRPVIASAPAVPGNPVGNLTDGDKRTFTHPNSGGTGFYYLIDLGQIRNLERVVIWNRADCCPERLRRYRVSLLADGGNVPGAVNWSADLRMDGTYSPRGGSDTVTRELGSGTFFGGRYIKIESRSSEGSNPQIAEVEAWPAPVPIIRRFDTDAGNLTATGQPGRPVSAALSWHVENFTSLTLSPVPGGLTEAVGTVTVTPAATTTYTLTATNASGTTTSGSMSRKSRRFSASSSRLPTPLTWMRTKMEKIGLRSPTPIRSPSTCRGFI